MITNKVIELTEEDVNAAVRMYIKDKLKNDEVSGAIRYYTGLFGKITCRSNVGRAIKNNKKFNNLEFKYI